MPHILKTENMKVTNDDAVSDPDLLARAVECWNALHEFRSERERCKRFTYGDQWNDMMVDRGVRMRERDYILSQGNMPLKNNLIRRLVRNVLGVYRNRWKMPRCTGRVDDSAREPAIVNCLLGHVAETNRLEELYARTMEEFLISGLAVHKKWYGRRRGASGCRTDLISPARFFFDRSAVDARGLDLTLVGEIHEMELGEVEAAFGETVCGTPVTEAYGMRRIDDPHAHCVVYEVWERTRTPLLRCHDRLAGRWFRAPLSAASAISEENRLRLERGESRLTETVRIFDEEWRYTFLTPSGRILARGMSPYPGATHPYVIKAYPFIDGEIHSFVSDIIDQQKLTNRLISMYDWILRASAKGVLLFPEGALPDGTDINDIADEWGRFNGVIVYRPRAGVPLPQQVSSRSADIGITELLEIQMKMMEDISGVNGALQGKLDSNSMSGTLYNQQTQNSLTALADLMKSFDDFVMEATRADVANILRFYSPRRILSLTGETVGRTFNQLNAKNVLKLTNQ